MLSVRGAEATRSRALELGADDYLTKPFGVDELLARIRVALRHAARSGARQRLRLPQRRPGGRPGAARGAAWPAAQVHLTPTEYALLGALIADAGRVLTDRALLQRVWGPEYGSEDHYLHVYMARLRKKLERDPAKPAPPAHRARRGLPAARARGRQPTELIEPMLRRCTRLR